MLCASQSVWTKAFTPDILGSQKRLLDTGSWLFVNVAKWSMECGPQIWWNIHGFWAHLYMLDSRLSWSPSVFDLPASQPVEIVVPSFWIGIQMAYFSLVNSGLCLHMWLLLAMAFILSVSIWIVFLCKIRANEWIAINMSIITCAFCEWPENDKLDVKRLRMEPIALLALVLMLWPSDIAPRAKIF